MTNTLKNPIFQDETAARIWLEGQRWPDGVICPFCGQIGAAKALPATGALGAGWWHCGDCRKKFTVRVGTLYERSHIPIYKWLYATHLLCSSKKGISSHQLSRMLGITYKSAWFMAHRIREGMAPMAGSDPPLGGEGKVVEADEAYIGKKDGKRKAAGAGGYAHKRTGLSLVERGGKIRSFKLGGSTRADIAPVIKANVDKASTLHTDGSKIYHGMAMTKGHESVEHAKEYVRDGVMVGTYQHCGEQHLQRYLAEFDFRMNNREKLGINDTMRAEKAVAGITGKRLTYRRINAA